MNFSWSAFCQSSSVRSRISPPGAAPALLTSTSIRPKRAAVASTMRRTSSGRVRSPATAKTSPPVARASSWAAASSEAVRHRLADALAAAGDQRRLSLQAEVHVRLLRRAGLTPASLSNIDRRTSAGGAQPRDRRKGAAMAKYLEGTDRQKSRAYSPAVITEGGRIVWLAGQTTLVDGDGKDISGNFEAQTHEVFTLIDQTLRRAGGALANLEVAGDIL